jgi:hypothetical protein
VRRWNSIINDTFFRFVHAFDKAPAPVAEADLHRDFAFLEEVMRGVLAPLEHVAELDEMLARRSAGQRLYPVIRTVAAALTRSRCRPVLLSTGAMAVRRVMTDEALSGWPEPTDAQIERLQSLTSHRARLRYFFARLETRSGCNG